MAVNDVYLVPSAEATLRDYNHASKLYRDDAFRFLPKQSNLFHVAFDFNREIGFGDTIAAERIEAGLLVKDVDLPSYTIKNRKNNAYNRKNIIQSQIEYGDVRVTFHDDSANLTNAMWQAYYEYYYADSYGEPAEYRLDTKYATRNRLNWGFVPPPRPFFSAIRIYSLYQKKFSGYTLINPLINSWDHGKHTSESDDAMTNTMGLVFESVLYSSGIIGEDEEPKFFTDMHYDNRISPLGKGASGTNPPKNVESTGANIRSNVGIFDQFFDGNWEGGVASLVDGLISGDGKKIKNQLISTTKNIGAAFIAGDNISDVYDFPIGISGPLNDLQTIASPVIAVQTITGKQEAGTRFQAENEAARPRTADSRVTSNNQTNGTKS